MPQVHGGDIAGHEANARYVSNGLGTEMLESLIEEAESEIADIKRKAIR